MKRYYAILMGLMLFTSFGFAQTAITLAEGAKVGVYVSYGSLKASGNFVDNACLTYDGNGGWNSATELRWKDTDSEANFYAYTPFVADIKDALGFVAEIQSDQTTKDAQTASDFLWGKGINRPNDGKPQFSLKHMFSKLVVTIVPGDGITEDELNDGSLSVRIKNVRTKTRVRLHDGRMDALDDLATIKTFQERPLTFSAVLVPQGEEQMKVVIVWNNTEYPVSIGKSFGQGRLYHLTATVKKIAGGINVSIGGWGDTGEDYGGTVN